MNVRFQFDSDPVTVTQLLRNQRNMVEALIALIQSELGPKLSDVQIIFRHILKGYNCPDLIITVGIPHSYEVTSRCDDLESKIRATLASITWDQSDESTLHKLFHEGKVEIEIALIGLMVVDE